MEYDPTTETAFRFLVRSLCAMISLANKGRTVNRYDRDLANTEVVSVGNYVGYTVKPNTVSDSETIKPAQTF